MGLRLTRSNPVGYSGDTIAELPPTFSDDDSKIYDAFSGTLPSGTPGDSDYQSLAAVMRSGVVIGADVLLYFTGAAGTTIANPVLWGNWNASGTGEGHQVVQLNNGNTIDCEAGLVLPINAYPWRRIAIQGTRAGGAFTLRWLAYSRR